MDPQSVCIGGVELRPVASEPVFPTPRRDDEGEPPPPGLFRAFAALSGAEPQPYADFASRHGALPCGAYDGRPYDNQESLLLWRWHAERMAYLVRVLEVWRAMHSRHWGLCRDLLRTLFDLDAEPIPDPHRWQYHAGSAMLEEEEPESWHTDQGAARGVIAVVWAVEDHPFQWYQRLAGWPSVPMTADAPRIYHPFHEGRSPLAFLAGARHLIRDGQVAFAFTARAERVRGAFLSEAPPDSLSAVEMKRLVRAALAEGIGLVARRFWDLTIEDPIKAKLDYAPRGVLGAVYDGFARSVADAELRLTRRCAVCGVELDLADRKDKQTCGPKCRVAKSRRTMKASPPSDAARS